MAFGLTERQRHRFRTWFFEGLREPEGPHARHPHQSAWWKVMCLTGVDYFSTLGYQPGIAFLAAGILSPLATLVLVLLTLFGALPMYRRVAELSPHGQGSISLLEELLPRWRGKALVLCLLGFAATGFIITITLSAADATAHIIENPLAPDWLQPPDPAHAGPARRRSARSSSRASAKRSASPFPIVARLPGAERGRRRVGPAPSLAASRGAARAGRTLALAEHGSWTRMMRRRAAAVPAARARPLGVRDRRRGDAAGPAAIPTTIPGIPRAASATRSKLLTTAALIMSVMLVGSSIVTTTLIPPEAFREGGEAYGRALAYLAHEHLGDTFGTLYDLSTVAILWFAGASALVGLLNLVPQYLPRYGMAPEWAKANRPLVLIFTAITFVVTILFEADVNAQGGAYATGVLVLMGSAALAVTIAAWRARHAVVRLPAADAHLRLHDARQHHRPPRRPEDRHHLHRRHRHQLAGVARAALDRAARAGRRSRRPGPRSFSPTPPAARCGSSPTGRTPGCRKSTSTS